VAGGIAAIRPELKADELLVRNILVVVHPPQTHLSGLQGAVRGALGRLTSAFCVERDG
jgi:hypothetical protein